MKRAFVLLASLLTFVGCTTPGKRTADGVDSIKQITGIVTQYPENRIMVIGHTDSIGTEDYNQKLSERRAESVRRMMVQQGFPAEHISAVGSGENAPRASNDTSTGRAQNRRVEIEITADAAAYQAQQKGS